MFRPALLQILLFLATNLVAQNKPTQTAATPSYTPDQCTVGFYSRDSIAKSMANGKPHYDVIARCHTTLDEIRARQIIVNDAWLRIKDDSALSATSKGREKQKAALMAVIDLTADSLIEIMKIKSEESALQPIHSRIDHIADSIGKQRGVKEVMELSTNSNMICPTDKMTMIDITNDIALALNVKPRLLRVGTFNGDSLLRLLPGYAVLADSTVAEMQEFTKALEVMDREINIMQHELDSLRPNLSGKKIKQREAQIAEKQEIRDVYHGYELYKIDLRDSLRTSEYKKKLRIAAANAAKEQNCPKYYEMETAHFYWTSKEAEFIDLNTEIAKQLKP